MKTFAFAPLAFIAIALASPASGQTIIDLATYHEIDDTNVGTTNWRGYEVVGGASSGTIGNSSSTFSGGRMSLATFQLPSLSQAITDADVSLYYNNGASFSFSGATIDLYVHNTFSSTELLTGQNVGDYNIPYADTSGSPSAAGYTLIQKDFIIPTVTTGETVSLSASGKLALTSFLQTNYTSANAGDYIVFAAALDTNGSTDAGVGMIYDGIAANASQQLTIATIPEPSVSILLLGTLGGLLGLHRRRAPLP